MKSLNFPGGSYVVYGSCPMAAAGIREAGDIDILVTTELLERLRKEGWKELVKSPNDKPVVKNGVEAMDTWAFSIYNPTLEHLLATADIYEDIPFANLQEVRRWKEASGRPKDLEDIKLIDAYLEKQK